MSEQDTYCFLDGTALRITLRERDEELAAAKQKLAEAEELAAGLALSLQNEQEDNQHWVQRVEALEADPRIAACVAACADIESSELAQVPYAKLLESHRRLEAERKELEKQEPVPSDYVFCPEYDETPAGMVQVGGAYIPANHAEIEGGLSCKLYASPVQAPDLQKRVDELKAEAKKWSGKWEALKLNHDLILPIAKGLEEENAELTKKLAEQQAAVFTVRTILAGSAGPVCTSAVAHIQKHFADNGAELDTLLSAEFTKGYDKGIKDTFVSASDAVTIFQNGKAEGVEEGKKLAVPEGWQVVPKEPTDKMVQVILENTKPKLQAQFYQNYVRVYKKMLAASPKPEKGEP